MAYKHRFLVYALHHPDSNRVYVGKSSYGLGRPKKHGCPSNLRTSRGPVIDWIEKLRKNGKDYEIAILEEIRSHEGLNDAEIFHIAALRCAGVPLLNLTAGGEGSFGMVGRKYPPERNKKIGDSNRGKKRTEEQKQVISAAHKGIPLSTAHKAKLSAAGIGREVTETTKNKIADSLRGHPVSDKIRTEISKKLAGRKLSENHKEQIAAGTARSWAPGGKRKRLCDCVFEWGNGKTSKRCRHGLRRYVRYD